MTRAQPAKRPAERTAYLVLGMHRSGTSAATQLLALAGADLPVNVMPGDEHNEEGYFEPWRIAVFNDQRLRAAGGAWDDVFAFPYRALDPEAEADWIERGAALLAEEYGRAGAPLLKDPRVSVLLPFWRRVLERSAISARCVTPVRHPLAVAGSLSRRNDFPAEKSVLLWTAYMLASEAYSRDLPRAFVSYDALLADWRCEAARIEAAHGAPLPALTAEAQTRIDRALRQDLRHNAGAGDLAGLGWAGELAARALAWFEQAAAGESPPCSALDAVGEALVDRAREFGNLVSPAARDLDAARSALLEARAQLARLEREREEIEALMDGLEPRS